MVKVRSATAAGAKAAQQEIPEAKINDLIDQLADKPYGEPAKRGPGRPRRVPKATPLTISLPDTMIERIEDVALKNKRKKKDLRTVSAIIRDALEAKGYGEPEEKVK